MLFFISVYISLFCHLFIVILYHCNNCYSVYFFTLSKYSLITRYSLYNCFDFIYKLIIINIKFYAEDTIFTSMHSLFIFIHLSNETSKSCNNCLHCVDVNLSSVSVRLLENTYRTLYVLINVRTDPHQLIVISDYNLCTWLGNYVNPLVPTLPLIIRAIN